MKVNEAKVDIYLQCSWILWLLVASLNRPPMAAAALLWVADTALYWLATPQLFRHQLHRWPTACPCLGLSPTWDNSILLYEMLKHGEVLLH
ncbi:hypothetical protein BDV25DRAFT_149532 [Aspergillus avenaceus]|uniref:Uncharacterized protein n=1 Tax=Aspergillus avenaceus TaxID=36643 RepID=A0A5N6U4E7_ASPAV|nr:hypothetical protein BDV25DRAFT_149532 [Aspergillus avenaceus]